VERVDGVVNVFNEVNSKCRARHSLGLLSEAQALVFIDDDVLLKDSRVCGTLIEGLKRHPRSVVGHEGRRCNGVSEKMYWGDGARHTGVEGPVSVVKGKLHAVRRELLRHAFAYDLPESVWTEDDIVLNACVQMATGEPSWTIAGIERKWFENMTDDLGNETRFDHFALRDSACRYMAELGWNPTLWRQFGK
jgi:hypothetical protein